MSTSSPEPAPHVETLRQQIEDMTFDQPFDTDYIDGCSVNWQRLFRDTVRAADPLIALATWIEYGQAEDLARIREAAGDAANLLFWFVDAEQRMRRRDAATGRSLFGEDPGIEVQE